AQPAEAVSPASWQERLRKLADVVERIDFSSPPELVLDVRGDARDLQSFGVVMLLTAPGADTPWGNVSQGDLNMRIYPAGTNGMSRAELHFEARDARTPWAAITNFGLTIQMVSFPNQTNLVEADLTLSTRNVATRWGSANNTRFGAHWVHAITDPVPLSGYGW